MKSTDAKQRCTFQRDKVAIFSQRNEDEEEKRDTIARKLKHKWRKQINIIHRNARNESEMKGKHQMPFEAKV